MVKLIMSPAKWVLALEIIIKVARELREYLRERKRSSQ